MGRMVYVRENKKLPYAPGHWPEKKKLEVIVTYLATGNYAETSRITNVPRRTIVEWAQSDWWKQQIEEIREGEGHVTDKKMSKIIDKALDLLIDRMDEGNFQYDPTRGKLVRVPLNTADITKVTQTLFDKRQLIRKQPTAIKQSVESTEARLAALAKEFAKFVGNKAPQEKLVEEYIEGETVVQDDDGVFCVKEEKECNNALHDEWQEGLQEGAELGTQEEAESC